MKVLHVDGDLAFPSIAKQCLEVQGHFQANVDLSVEEALQELKKEEYDTVVSGYHLLEKDGL